MDEEGKVDISSDNFKSKIKEFQLNAYKVVLKDEKIIELIEYYELYYSNKENCKKNLICNEIDNFLQKENIINLSNYKKKCSEKIDRYILIINNTLNEIYESDKKNQNIVFNIAFFYDKIKIYYSKLNENVENICYYFYHKAAKLNSNEAAIILSVKEESYKKWIENWNKSIVDNFIKESNGITDLQELEEKKKKFIGKILIPIINNCSLTLNDCYISELSNIELFNII